MIKLMFWVLVALDLAAVLLFFVLGLAAAGSARTGTAAVVGWMLVLPAAVLVAAIVVFMRSTSAVGRGLSFALVAAPLLLTVTTYWINHTVIRLNSNAQGELTFFTAGAQRELAEAIGRNDAAAVAALAGRADLNARGLMGMTPLVLALRQLRSTPTQHEVLQALLTAGADPNLGTEHEQPLEMALQIGHKAGRAPVEMLLKAGAKPNLRNEWGTPIFFGAAGRGSTTEMLELMLRHGADLRAVTPKGETVLTYAATAHSWHAVRHLLDAGADPTQGRNGQGLSVQQLVDDALRQREARGAQAADDGLQEVVQRLRARRP